MCLSIHQGSFEGCGCVTRVATALLSLPPLLFPYFPAFRSVPYYSLSTRSNALFFFFFFFFPRRSAARSPRAFLEKRRRTCAVHPIEKISRPLSFPNYSWTRGEFLKANRDISKRKTCQPIRLIRFVDSPRNLDLDGCNWKSIFHPSSRWIIVAIICSNNGGEGGWSFFGPVSFSRCYEVIHGRKIRREMAMHACLYFAFKESSDPRYYAF